MAGGYVAPSQARELDHTPTWAVAAVCGVIVIISILLEKCLHSLGKWFQERKKKPMYEALEKIKGELMVLGFISLILTFGQNYIIDICIPLKAADTMLPCPLREANHNHHRHESGHDHDMDQGEAEHHRRLLWNERRSLAADNPKGCRPGFVPLISAHGLHQLHIFIFFLAVFHVIYSALTMMLGRLKIRRWKEWERQTVDEQDSMNDASRFRLTHETSFVREHSRFWTRTCFSFYFVCFFRQFIRSVRRADYLSMRHGFITVHLAPGSKFDFQKYIKRSLEDDFKVVVGISPLLWTSAVIFLLVDVAEWQSAYVLSMLPLFVILSVGTKLQAIITQMALEIKERHAVVQGIPLVQVSDRHFWFSWPQLVLYCIHFTLFQNAFEITHFFWIWYEFGLRSCFHKNFNLTIVRVCLGTGVQFMCSYITLPLYALVTQMGSTMKKSIFDEQTSKALKKWHKKAVKKTGSGRRNAGTVTQTMGVKNTNGSQLSPPQGRPQKNADPDEAFNVNSDPSTPGPMVANIMADVDLEGEHQHHDDRGFPFGNRDLLTGP